AIQELGLEPAQTTALLAAAIAAAIPGSFVAGWAVSRFGALRVLRATLVVWVFALAIGVVAGTDGVSALARVIGPVCGHALGATWTSDRVVMTDISPPEHLGEMYGLYATVGRFATILGPLVWALVVGVLARPRTAARGPDAALGPRGVRGAGGLRRAVTGTDRASG